MGLMDKLTEGAERAAREAEKAFDKGKTKVGELQTEMQMDGLARKLGYLVFDFYRGRQVDQAYRQRILDDMSRLEDQLLSSRAQAAANAQSAPADDAATAGSTAGREGTQAGADTGSAANGASDSETGESSPSGAGSRSASDEDRASTGEAPSAEDSGRAGGDSATIS